MGYSFITNGRISLERERNDALAGQENEFESLFAGLEGREAEGQDVVTNLDVAGTEAAVAALAGRKGAVVAIEPQTGKVRVMVSIPDYDPNLIPSEFGRLNRDPNKPTLNRTTQELYPPGSTFKVVTATAALDSGKVTPETVIDGSSPKTISGVPLANAGGQSFGPISFTDALTNSVNTVFAQVGETIGRGTLVEYMKRFGFYEDPQLDYPEGQMVPSGVINGDGRYVEDGFDVGRAAIGQGGLEGEVRAGPLQMALVAAAVANGGRLMKPQLTDRIVRKDGRVAERIEPDLQSKVMKARDRRAADRHDEPCGGGRNRHRRGARRHHRGGEDGYGRGGRQPRVHPALVHRLRTRRESEDGDRRDGRAHHRPGWNRGRADSQTGARGHAGERAVVSGAGA